MSMTRAQLTSLILVLITLFELFGFNIDEESKTSLIENIPQLLMLFLGAGTYFNITKSNFSEIDNLFSNKKDL